jgi:hypothetical protein
MTPSPDPVEAYLDEAFDALAGTGPAGRRTLAEIEDHLREAAAEEASAGRGEAEAGRLAVARFGSVDEVAGRVLADVVAADGRQLRRLLRRFVGATAVVAALGMVAVGVAGVAAELFGRWFGWAFVAGDPPGVTYSPARCAEYLEYFPDAGGCAQAALSHHFGEVVFYRVAAGVLGLIVLAVLWGLRRHPRLRPWLPTRELVAALGALGAGAAAVAMLGYGGLMLAGLGVDHGAGDPLSLGTVALPTAVAFAWTLRRRSAAV